MDPLSNAAEIVHQIDYRWEEYTSGLGPAAYSHTRRADMDTADDWISPWYEIPTSPKKSEFPAPQLTLCYLNEGGRAAIIGRRRDPNVGESRQQIFACALVGPSELLTTELALGLRAANWPLAVDGLTDGAKGPIAVASLWERVGGAREQLAIQARAQASTGQLANLIAAVLRYPRWRPNVSNPLSIFGAFESEVPALMTGLYDILWPFALPEDLSWSTFEANQSSRGRSPWLLFLPSEPPTPTSGTVVRTVPVALDQISVEDVFSALATELVKEYSQLTELGPVRSRLQHEELIDADNNTAWCTRVLTPASAVVPKTHAHARSEPAEAPLLHTEDQKGAPTDTDTRPTSETDLESPLDPNANEIAPDPVAAGVQGVLGWLHACSQNPVNQRPEWVYDTLVGAIEELGGFRGSESEKYFDNFYSAAVRNAQVSSPSVARSERYPGPNRVPQISEGWKNVEARLEDFRWRLGYGQISALEVMPSLLDLVWELAKIRSPIAEEDPRIITEIQTGFAAFLLASQTIVRNEELPSTPAPPQLYPSPSTDPVQQPPHAEGSGQASFPAEAEALRVSRISKLNTTGYLLDHAQDYSFERLVGLLVSGLIGPDKPRFDVNPNQLAEMVIDKFSVDNNLAVGSRARLDESVAQYIKRIPMAASPPNDDGQGTSSPQAVHKAGPDQHDPDSGWLLLIFQIGLGLILIGLPIFLFIVTQVI